MGEKQLPKAALEWIHLKKKKRKWERPKTSWPDNTRKVLNDRNLQDKHWQDRIRQRKSLEIRQC
jgi:hypothetical protein